MLNLSPIFSNVNDINRIKWSINQIDEIINRSKSDDLSLFNGKAGELLCKALVGSKYLLIDDEIEQCIKGVEENPMMSSLCSGFTGITWLINYFISEDLIRYGSDYTEEIDEYIFEYCEFNLTHKNIDFLHGGLGQLIYLVSETKSLSSQKKDYLFDLFKLASFNHNGFTVWKPSNILNEESMIDLGMAHGMLAILRFFSISWKNGIKTDESEFYINNILNFYTQDFGINLNENQNFYPTKILKNGKRYSDTIGWCYGDLIIGYILVLTASEFNFSQIKLIGEKIIDQVILRLSIESIITEIGFCHGSVGIAHIFNRLYQLTFNLNYKNQSIRWYNITLDRLNTLSVESESDLSDNLCLLDGLSGISLSLQSSIDTKFLSWDRIFLLS